MLFSLLFLCSPLSPSAVSALDPATLGRFTLLNHTGFDLHHIFLSPADSEKWGADILSAVVHESLLPAEDVLNFYVHYGDSPILFDILAIDEDGDCYVMRDIPGQDNLYLAIGREHYKKMRTVPGGRLVLTNVADRDMWFMFISPGDSAVWGADLLTDEGLFQVGESISLTLSEGEYDFLGLTETGEIYYRELRVLEDTLFVEINADDRK